MIKHLPGGQRIDDDLRAMAIEHRPIMRNDIGEMATALIFSLRSELSIPMLLGAIVGPK